jgi:glycosyltransferase involved in cell wall biosynthesis
MANLRKGVLDKINDFLKKQEYSWEIIVVDDGSSDGSLEFAEKFAKENPSFTVLKNSHLGKAGAVTAGMLEAKGELRLFTDMDQATPIEEINNLLPFVKDYDVVIGSRSGQRKGAPVTRLIMANGMIVLRRILVGIPGIKDTQCGFKLFKKEAAEKIFSKIKQIKKGFHNISGSSVTAGFDIELLLLADKMGFKIKEVPVEWLYVETRRVSPIKDSFDGLFDLFRIRLNELKGFYNV